MQVDLDLLVYQEQIKLTEKNRQKMIWCAIRRKYLVLTPEEMVRQLVLLYLIEQIKVPVNRIRVEMGLEVNSMKRRCDILVFNEAIEPLLLVECKAPHIAVTQKTFTQIANYNRTFQLPYLLVSNGPANYFAHIDYENADYAFKSSIPTYENLNH